MQYAAAITAAAAALAAAATVVAVARAGITIHKLDVCSTEDVNRLVGSLDHVDVLFNCAG